MLAIRPTSLPRWPEWNFPMHAGTRLIRCLLPGLLLVLASGCGDGLTKGRAEAALEASFGRQDACWTPTDIDNRRFPLQVDFDSSERNGNAILGALAQAGLVTLSGKRVPANSNGLLGRQAMVIDLTDAGRNAEAWHPRNGFCVGTKVVDDVAQWTEPTRGTDAQLSRVFYTWRIDQVPAWARDPAFATLQGMTEPVEATVTLRKLNDGWTVVP